MTSPFMFTPRVLPELDLSCLICVEIVVVDGWRYVWAVYYHHASTQGQLIHKETNRAYEARLNQANEAYEASLRKDF